MAASGQPPPADLTAIYTSCLTPRVKVRADYRQALDAAVREYEELGRKRREIDERLAQLSHTIGTLNRLCGATPNVFWGLTDACRLVLRCAGHPMTPTEVRDQLQGIGLDLSKYSSSLAAIHTVLKRLRDADEIRFVQLDSGRFAYEWDRPPRSRALNESALSRLESRAAKPRKRK
jgi:hypothetical protein